MANTFIPIATVTVGAGGTSSIDFTSIPQTYNDLFIEISARSSRSATGDQILYKLNNSTSNLTFLTYEARPGTGNNPITFNGTGVLYIGAHPAANSTTATFGSSSLYLPEYSGSNIKSGSADAVQEGLYTTAYCTITANLWSDTSAITSISLYWETAGSTFVQHSTATLYGIKNS